MVSFTHALFSLALLTLSIGSTLAMDQTLRNKAMQAYRDWFPGSTVNFQDGRYNERLIPHLRELKGLGLLKIREVAPSDHHRYFIAPLDMQGSFDEFQLRYSTTKNFFAAFHMPIDGTSATFDGIGEINGPKRVEVARKFASVIESFTPLQYRIYLHIP